MVKGSLLVAVLLSAIGMACSVNPVGQDLFTTPSETKPAPKPTPKPSPAPTPSPSPEPCEEDRGCSDDETAYTGVTACTNAGNDLCRLVKSSCDASSWYCGSRTSDNCRAVPTCDAGDPEVLDTDDCALPTFDCYARTTCGTTIWCNNVK
jgi:hypothetical protein